MSLRMYVFSKFACAVQSYKILSKFRTLQIDAMSCPFLRPKEQNWEGQRILRRCLPSVNLNIPLSAAVCPDWVTAIVVQI